MDLCIKSFKELKDDWHQQQKLIGIMKGVGPLQKIAENK
jgi:hypothetical protein